MPRSLILIISLLVLIVGIGAGTAAALYFGFQKKAPSAQHPAPKTSNKADSVIAIVGEERIFDEDLKAVLAGLPDTQETRASLLNVLIEESAALQGGAEEGLIVLKPAWFNTRNKDRKGRSDALAAIKQKIEAAEPRVSGAVLSIWFYNNGVEALPNYETGKSIALEKLSAVHAAIKNGSISVEEGGSQLKSDTSLFALDSVYPQNVYTPFADIGTEEQITFDPQFDAEIRKLNEGEVSPIRLLSVPDSDGSREAMYAFAVVSERKGEDRGISYAEWIKQQLKRYPRKK